MCSISAYNSASRRMTSLQIDILEKLSRRWTDSMLGPARCVPTWSLRVGCVLRYFGSISVDLGGFNPNPTFLCNEKVDDQTIGCVRMGEVQSCESVWERTPYDPVQQAQARCDSLSSAMEDESYRRRSKIVNTLEDSLARCEDCRA